MHDSPGRESEIDEGDFGGYFRGVVRVGQFGSYVEPEVLVVRNDSVSQSDYQRALLFERLKQIAAQ